VTRYTLKQIEYFVAAAETGSITLASERVHISQPSISSAISNLESEFGIQLFIRHHAQGLSLTPQGQRVLREAKSLLLQAEELTAAASELSTKVGGVLNLGCLLTLYPLLLPELLHAFKARHDAVRIDAVACDQPALIEQLRTGRFSLVLSYDMSLPADIDFTPLATLPPFAFVAANHRLPRQRSTTIEALTGEPFLLLDLPISRDYFLSLFRRVGLMPHIAGRFEHMEVIRSLAARGEGFGLANAQPRNRASLDGRRLAYLALEGNPRPLTLGILMVKNMRLTQTMQAFVTLCQELIRDQWQAEPP
jgi:DNA-binding transcriptional LysR family regulator